MFYHKFFLDENFPEVALTAYVSDPTPTVAPRPAVVVCPGGGYQFVSEREAEPIAKKLFGEGFNVYVLNYSVAEHAKDNAPLIQVAKSVKLVRERASEDNTDPKKIFTMGFSAGGHLACSAGVYWNLPAVRDALGITEGQAPEGINRPDGMVLCYPVITGGVFAHKGSVKNASGMEEPDGAAIDHFSLELHVDDTTPPAFLWHTFNDKSVPVKNSLLFINALVDAGIPVEAHIFPDGVHGLSLCTAETAVRPEHIRPEIAPWIDLAMSWMKR